MSEQDDGKPITFKPEPDVAKAIAGELEKRPGVVRTFVLNEVLREGFKAKAKRKEKVGT